MEKEIRNYICWENSSLVNKLTGACASGKYVWADVTGF